MLCMIYFVVDRKRKRRTSWQLASRYCSLRSRQRWRVFVQIPARLVLFWSTITRPSQESGDVSSLIPLSIRRLLQKCKKIEKAMSFITAEVKKKSYDELSHLRLVAKPCPEGNQNIALFYEAWNEIKSLQIEIVESEALQMSEKTKGLKDLLTQLQNLTTKDCSWQDLEKIQRNITTFLRIKNCP